MKKHQFVKANCDCHHRVTVFTCKYCGEMEYASIDEIQHMGAIEATCTGEEAPIADPVEVFLQYKGGTFNCLSPDYD